MRVACIFSSRSSAGIDGGTNSISRMILVDDSGSARSMALKSRPAARGFLRRVGFAGSIVACAVMNAIRSRMCTMPTGSSSVSL